MFKKGSSLFIVLILFFQQLAISQINLTYPVEREVFQRSNNNTGYIQIAGSIATEADYLLARLVPVYPGSGIETAWKRIANGPFKGVFTTKISGTGGWYKLEIVSYKDGNQTDYAAINKVGIGEVFVLSGQSNAEGDLKYTGSEIGSKEDRISVINYQDIFMREELLPFEFTTLDDYNKIGPYNPLPWFWARLAERIVKEYNVPVAMYGCANGGTSSAMWYDSMMGKDLTKEHNVIIKFAGSPFQIIARTLQNYVSRTGARAILWQQGESDYYTNPFEYYSRIRDVSLKTSEVIDDRMSWIIAVASRTPGASEIAYAQQLLINNEEHIYQGPNTDQIFGPNYRYDGIHFFKDGLNLVAQAWFDAIKNGNLLNTIPPVLPKDLIQVNVACENENTKELKFTLSSAYDFYQWSDGSNGATTTSSNPFVGLKARKNGIVYFSPLFIRNDNQFIKPNVKITGPSTFCIDQANTVLYADKTSNFRWNTNETSTEIRPKSNGEYYVLSSNSYGCTLKSNTVNIKINPKPVPSVNYSKGIPYYCQGQSIEVSTTNNFLTYNWDNTGTNQKYILNQPGRHFLLVKDNNNCISDSTYFTVNEVNLPPRPTITKNSPFVLGLSFEDSSIVKSIQWTLNDQPYKVNTNEVYFNQTGIYKSNYTGEVSLGENGSITCVSETSDPFIAIASDIEKSIVVYPNPTADLINIESIQNDIPVTYILVNAKGESILSGTRSFKELYAPISLKNLPTGMYVLKLKQGDLSQNQKIIINP